jgi:putative SOS response-associated peptidase YedK
VCGRYVAPDAAAIEAAWHIGRQSSNPFAVRYNVQPTSMVPILRGEPARGEPALVEARWGFIPPWWKQAKLPSHCFNARSEDAREKPMWRGAYRFARCLVPALGWYEWRDAERTDPRTGEIRAYRQPHYIYRPDRRPVCFAGLMASWRPPGKEALLSCAILTRPAVPAVADIHERMPVVLEESFFADWLDPGLADPDKVSAIIRAGQSGFAHHAVTPRLNAAKTDEPEFMENREKAE